MKGYRPPTITALFARDDPSHDEPEKELHDVAIESNGFATEIKLDGMILKGVKSFRLEQGADEMPLLTVELFPGSVNPS